MVDPYAIVRRLTDHEFITPTDARQLTDAFDGMIDEIAALKAENETLREDNKVLQTEACRAWGLLKETAERALAERAGGVKVPLAVRQAADFTRKDLGADGTNYPHVRAMLAFIEALTTEPAAPEGRQEAVAWQHIPGCGTDRESKMVFVSEGVFCDPCIAPLVAALNAAGIETVASCCGHDHRPGSIALRDGRCLVIARDLDEWRKIDATFPTDINGDTRPAEQAVTEDDVAARLWKAEAEDAGAPASLAAGRTRAAFDEQSAATKARWRKFAKAAMEAGRHD